MTALKERDGANGRQRRFLSNTKALTTVTSATASCQLAASDSCRHGGSRKRQASSRRGDRIHLSVDTSLFLKLLSAVTL